MYTVETKKSDTSLITSSSSILLRSQRRSQTVFIVLALRSIVRCIFGKAVVTHLLLYAVRGGCPTSRLFQSSSVRVLICCISYTTLFVSMSLRTSAEVVLDDFEVPQSISAPGDLVKTGAQYLGVTPPKPVGGIAALRELGIYGLGGVPHAYASSNLTLPGMLLLDKTDLLILPGEDNALMSFDIVYSLPNLGVDLTEGGANGGILVDFHSLSPNALPESLNVYIQQDQAVYYRFLNQLEYIPTSSLDRPFSLFIPFDTFSTRGIPSSFERFTNVQRMVFSVFNGYESAADSSSYPYTIALDSVRIGNAVPEPPAIFGIAAVIFFSPVRRRRFLACHKKGEE